MAFLGLSFIACALLIIGMPPLSGFIGKLNLISALFNPQGLGVASEQTLSATAWAYLALLILSGLASLIALARVGMQRFWTPHERPSPLLRLNECVPIMVLLGLCVMLAMRAEPLLRYTADTAAMLDDPKQYVMTVLGAQPIPSPTAASLEGEP